jgi:WXG100 family type VII secretion target
MGDAIQVSFGELESLGGQIATISGTVESEIEDLRGQISNLQTIWTGGTSDAFQAVKQQWFNAAADLQQVLSAIGAAIKAAEEAYRGVESKNAQAWG